MTTEARTMTVEVWSDIMCPFCFLGKHRFATALQRFPQREDVAVVWRSFQLNPSLRTDPTITVNEYLARTKGIDVRQASAMNDRLTSAGAAEGIEYRFDRAVVAEAEELGIHGVPFFLFDRRYAVSGAQDSSVFLRALEQTWATGG